MIQESLRNQIGNASNPYQGKDTRVLCVCSAGLLRSPTIADVLTKYGGFNCRAAGMSQEYALIPVSTALLMWADKIVVVKEQANSLYDSLKQYGIVKDVTVLDIPDSYGRNDPDLVNAITEGLSKAGYFE